MKIVAMSDTHGKHRKMNEHDVPDGDVLIHAGDFTGQGSKSEAIDFLTWFDSFPHDHKLVIAGNHDFVMEGASRQKKEVLNFLKETDIQYLEDSTTSINGVIFHGSPYCNTYEQYAFNDEMTPVSPKVDVLITHGPPKGTMDCIKGEGHVGSSEIKDQVEKVTPDHHIFGHIHEQFGSQGPYHNVSLPDDHDYLRIKEKPLSFNYETPQ
jgi:Icc-related predicted phosphoesterase